MNQVSVKFDLYEKIKEAQQKDDLIVKIVEKVQRGETQDFIVESGLLRRESLIYMPPDYELKEQIMMEALCTPYTTHPETIKIYQDLRSIF